MRRYTKHLMNFNNLRIRSFTRHGNSPCLHTAALGLAELCLSALSFRYGQQFQTPSDMDQAHQPCCYSSPGDKTSTDVTTLKLQVTLPSLSSTAFLCFNQDRFFNFSLGHAAQHHLLQRSGKTVRSDKPRLQLEKHSPIC